MKQSIIDPTFPFASAKSDTKLEPELQSTYQNWKTSATPETRAAMLQGIRPITDRALSMYGASGNPYAAGQAKVLALQALHTYDPARGSLRTHLLTNLQRLQRVTGQSDQIISVPERLALNRKHLLEATNELRDNLGRDPDDIEIANHTGMSMAQLQRVRRTAAGMNTGSLLDEEGDTYSPASTIPGVNHLNDVWTQLIYHDLGTMDRQILAHSLGLFGHAQKTTGELAKMLHLTPGAISQRKSKIQQLLDQQYESDLYGGQ